MSDYDVGFYFRKDAEEHWIKTLAAFMVFNVNDEAEKYLSTWASEINKVPKLDRWRGFGQSTQWFAATKCTKVKFADFTTCCGAPYFSKNFHHEADLWLNSNSVVLGIGKVGYDIARRKSWDDLKRGLPRYTLTSRWVMTTGFVRNLTSKMYRLIIAWLQ